MSRRGPPTSLILDRCRRVPFYMELHPEWEAQRAFHLIGHARGLLTPRRATLAPLFSGSTHTDIEPCSCEVSCCHSVWGGRMSPRRQQRPQAATASRSGTVIPEVPCRLWAFGSGAYGGGPLPTPVL